MWRRGIVIIDWQVLAADSSVRSWKFRVERDDDSHIVAQEDLASDYRRKVLGADDGVPDWTVGTYTVFLAAVGEDGEVSDYDQLTFYYFAGVGDIPPAPILTPASQEITAEWDAPALEDNQRVSKYEVRYRTGYNSYIFDAYDQSSPGSVEANEWALIGGAGNALPLTMPQLTMTIAKDNAAWIRVGEQAAPKGNLDQQPTLALGTFLGATGAFRINDYIGLKVDNSWVLWTYAGWQNDTTLPRTGYRLNLSGTGTGAAFKPTVAEFHIAASGENIEDDSAAHIQFLGQWHAALSINETSTGRAPNITYTAPEPELVMNNDAEGPRVRLFDGLWYDVAYRWEVTTTTTDDSGVSTETKELSLWSHVATTQAGEQEIKPPPPRNFRLLSTTKLSAAWREPPPSPFNIARYEIRWKQGDGSYPTKVEDGETIPAPQISVAHSDEQSAYTADVTTSPVAGTVYAAQARAVATLTDVAAGEPTEAFSEWTDEAQLTFGARSRKLVGFQLSTGERRGEVKWSFPAP